MMYTNKNRNYFYFIVVFLSLLITLCSFPVLANTMEDKNHIINIFVDQEHGFYKVYEIDKNLSKAIPYNNNTLNISIGDTVFWQNDAAPDTRLTIMSDPNLWNNAGELPMNYKRFGYTFNESGTYKIYIKEFPRLNQTINVGISNMSLHNNVSNLINSTFNQSYIILNRTNMDITTSNNVENMDINASLPVNNKIENMNMANNNNEDNSNYNSNNFVKNNFGTIMLILILLSIIILSGRIKN